MRNSSFGFDKQETPAKALQRGYKWPEALLISKSLALVGFLDIVSLYKFQAKLKRSQGSRGSPMHPICLIFVRIL